MTHRVKFLVDIVVGVVAGGIAYYIALPGENESTLTSASHRPAVSDANDHRSRGSASGSHRSALIAPLAIPEETMDAGVSNEDRVAMLTLRNEVIRASSEDMHRRGVSVMKCLENTRLAGDEKIRFSADVVSTPLGATIERWRFIEVADGEPLPDSFPSCATRAFGAGQHLAPPKDFPFPEYSGEVRILYVIPAPSSG